jgi:hypothetical protein
MRLRKIIIILIKLPAKSCGMKHHLKFDLEISAKGTQSSALNFVHSELAPLKSSKSEDFLVTVKTSYLSVAMATP